MGLIHRGIALGIISIVVSLYLFTPTHDWNIFRQILTGVSAFTAIGGIVVSIIAGKLQPGKLTKVGLVIGVIAVLLVAAIPNFIKGV